jgi:hypothetical protein
MSGLRRTWPIALGLGLLLHATAGATVVTRLDLPQMVQAADRIVVGSVEGAESVWIGRMLFTRYTVRVEETLYGEAAPAVSVLVPGGVDRSRPIPLGVAISGAPALFRTERAVLLLEAARSGSDLQIVGFNQGRFTVIGDRVAAGGGSAAQRTQSLAGLRDSLRALIARRASGLPPQSRRLR